ncbi:MAG: tetratricopeptide repeat protein [Clostridiaceae bacterium]|nr:tetratricopeptide repeat protein [Clostridiaceae bacterium]
MAWDRFALWRGAVYWYNKGVDLHRSGDYKKAIQCFDRALEKDPEDADAWYNKGVALYDLDRYGEAIQCYDRALEIDPEYVNACNNKGLALKTLRLYDEAIQCYDRALERDPECAKVWHNKGNTLYDLRRYNEAIQCYDRVLEIDPEHILAKDSRERALKKDRPVDRATGVAKHKFTPGRDAINWYNLGVTYRSSGHHDQAIQCFDRALETEPKYAHAWNSKGDVLADLGRYNEAIQCYDRALEIDPKYAKAWSNKGIALKNFGRYAEAIQCYDRALKRDPKHADTWYNKGAALYDLGRYDEAIQCFDRALERDPKYAKAWNNKGIALKNFGRYDEAIQCFDRALEIDPEHTFAKSTRDDALKKEDVVAKPDISITLSHTSIYANEWNKIELTLVNTGTTPASEITLSFSDDVEIRLLKPVVDLAARESTTVEAGIRPRAMGNIPLEITARYHDARNRAYERTTSLWLSVVPRSDSPGSPLLSSIPHPMTPKSLPPEIVEKYAASELIGRGGFARVLKVQKPDGSWVALKIPISLDEATGRSFIAELQNWTSLVHENIVRVNDYNILPLPYFEMELCDKALAALECPIPPDHAAWLIFNVCEGLKYAHARGILHRDLKPQNIMLQDGIPKISDWGLSKVMTQSRTTTVSGGFTAYYAAPEQISNKPKDQRTDIWQIGVILYELVTGRLPFAGESMIEIGMAIATRAPEQPGAVHPGAEPLDEIILKCLEKDPEQRYQSVADLQKDLAVYLKMNYVESLKESTRANDLSRSAYYCGDLVLISMKIGDLVAAYKYASDFARYAGVATQAQATELAGQIKARVEMGAQELPGELVQKAEVIVHQVRVR